jgi:fibronectin type 3 domain-containing protein
MSGSRSYGLLLSTLLLLPALSGFAQEGPLAYVLPATDKVIIVLGETPRIVAGFQVFRKTAGESSFKPLTSGPVLPAADAWQAAQLIGGDMTWIAQMVKTKDPEEVWRKLNADRPMALSLCLVSHGLRLALGRTLVDLAVKPGQSYTYRVVTVDSAGKELGRIEKQLKVTDPEPPAKVKELRVEPGDGEAKLSWDYPAYAGGEADRTVAFVVYREETGKAAERLTASPVFRVEGHLEHLDQTARNGATYVYGIEALDIIGATSGRTRSRPASPKDTTPPLAPMGLAAADQEQGVLLVWRMSPELDASHYDVWRGDGLQQEFVKINRAPVPRDDPRYLDTEPKRGTPQYYKVTAVDGNGNESPAAGPVTIIAKDTTPPPPVTGLSSTVDKEKRAVSLAWRPLNVPDLQGYYLYRGDKGGEMLRIVGKPIDASRSPAFVDSGFEGKGLAPGAVLVYAVTGVDQSSNEGEKSFIEIQIPDNVPPAAPLSFGARPTAEGSVELVWQPGLSSDLEANRVYRDEGNGFQLVAELEKKTTGWIDRTVIRGKPYTYRVTGIDAAKNESAPSKEIRIVPTDTTPPPAPGEVTARAAVKGVLVEWKPSNAEDLAGYIVYRSVRRTGPWERLTPKPIAEVRFTDGKGNAGSWYAVSAVDTSGNEGSKQEGLAR